MSSNGPSFAIVTPSYNTGRYLGAAVRSVLEQDWPDVDYVVMDGGSTDDSIELLRGFGPRVRWVSEPDKGQTDAINRGLARTRGEILGWLNSDDTYLPGTLRAVGEFFAAHPEVALVYGDANFIDARGALIAPCATWSLSAASGSSATATSSSSRLPSSAAPRSKRSAGSTHRCTGPWTGTCGSNWRGSLRSSTSAARSPTTAGWRAPRRHQGGGRD